jgi:hypothetical protein
VGIRLCGEGNGWNGFYCDTALNAVSVELPRPRLVVMATAFSLSESADQMPAPFKRSKVFLAGKPPFYLLNHVFAI